MKNSLQITMAAVTAAVLWPGAAAALSMYYGIAGSTNGTGYIYQPEGPLPVSTSNAGCANNYCVATTVKAGPDGLGAYYYQGGSGNYVAAGNGSAGVGARGDFELVAAQPGGPASIQATLRLELSGGTRGQAAGEAKASGGYALTAGVNGWGGASFKEFFAYGQPNQPIQFLNMEHAGDGQYLAHLTVPVGVPFELRLTLEAFGAASGAGGNSFVEAAYANTLVLAHSGPVFLLPAGYSAQSVDWGVQDNQWCGQTCGTAPVPEPASLVLLGMGLCMLHLRRQQRRPAVTTARTCEAKLRRIFVIPLSWRRRRRNHAPGRTALSLPGAADFCKRLGLRRDAVARRPAVADPAAP